MPAMRIAIASDHAGFPLKIKMHVWLTQQGHSVADCGVDTETSSVDYPDFARKAVRLLTDGQVDRVVLMCGSGLGMCIAANRHHGVRAITARCEWDAQMGREHNDANVLCLGGRITTPEYAQVLCEIFLNTVFAGGRHAGRVKKLDEGC